MAASPGWVGPVSCRHCDAQWLAARPLGVVFIRCPFCRLRSDGRAYVALWRMNVLDLEPWERHINEQRRHSYRFEPC